MQQRMLQVCDGNITGGTRERDHLDRKRAEGNRSLLTGDQGQRIHPHRGTDSFRSFHGSTNRRRCAAQTARVLENLKAIVEAGGSSLDKAVKATVYLKDMNDFAAMNEVYGRYFSKNPPARSTVEVSRLPRDVRVEIDLVTLA